jgi:alpha-beta hydrolase superfamily lysophospholipase
VYADGDAEWRRGQIEPAVAALKAAGQERVEVIEIQDRNHLSIIEKLVEKDDLASSRIADFILRPKQSME